MSKIIRNDLKPSAHTVPRHLQKAILRIGGTNIYDEPLYRLVRAEDRLQTAAGAWTIWKPGTSLDDRCGLGINDIQKMLRQAQEYAIAADIALSKHEAEKWKRTLGNQIDEFIQQKLKLATPLRVDRGTTQLPVYNFTGWIIEKWKPAEACGSPADWYQYRFEGEPCLGPYPLSGMYELCAGPTPYMPTITEIEEAIRKEQRILEERSSSPRERMCQIMRQIEQQQDQEAKEMFNQIDAAYKETSPLMRRISLGAGKVRTELAEKAGIKEHVGN